MQKLLGEVLDNQGIIKSGLSDIKASLKSLSEEFEKVKNLPRDVEVKIERLYHHLDSKLMKVGDDTDKIEEYIIEIKRWFEYYDLLEEKSRRYLPEAEYLFDRIAELKNADYSPFILQYCRALENELLKKIFRSYVKSLQKRDIQIDNLFAWDLGNKPSGKPNNINTMKLAKNLKKYLDRDEDKWFFELGTMEFNLRFLTGTTVSKSPLLQDFQDFVLHKFKEEILNVEYLDEIKRIIIEYRNQSAHPGLITAEQAVEFHEAIKASLIKLLENFKQY